MFNNYCKMISIPERTFGMDIKQCNCAKKLNCFTQSNDMTKKTELIPSLE